MKFLDEISVRVVAGNGGNGAVSFRRAKFEPRGGPDGGDGGRGGSIVLLATSRYNTLYHLHNRKIYKAKAGQPGGPSKKSGVTGDDLVIQVPMGTVVFDLEGNEIADLTLEGERFVLAQGGNGGRGNWQFRGPILQAPTFAGDGKPGESGEYRLELKLIAEVGLIGYPNVGKSTLIRQISSSKSKIGAYPFTTRFPHLAVVRRPDHRPPLVIADLPGLIDGASQGAGLGHQFLRHAERTRCFVHILSAEFGTAARQKFDAINRELENFNPALLKRPQIVVLNKIDLLDDPQQLETIAADFRDYSFYAISALELQGLKPLVQHLHKLTSDDSTTDEPVGS